MGIYKVGCLTLQWWLATGLYRKDSAIDVPGILLSCLSETLTFVPVHLPLLQIILTML